MPGQCVITREFAVAEGVFAPGHLGELTQVLDFDLVDAVAAETGTVQRRVRLLPTRVVIYFVLALALFEHSGYRRVWAKLTAGLVGLTLVTPTAGALSRARRRVGPKPLRALFEAVAGVVGRPTTPGVFWRGMRTVALDATTLHVPEALCRTGSALGFGVGYARRSHTRLGSRLTFGYPLLRLSVLVECGTRAVVAAVFGPEADGETTHAVRLLHAVRAGMLVLADAGYDSWTLLRDITTNGAEFLCRATSRRTPLVLRELSDGSYLSVLGYGRLKVRIIEAWVTVTWADGTVTREQWRLVTSLRDHRRYPAADLVDLYHRRWQAETTYLSIKSTILDGRVLRSHRPDDIDQEIYALLTVYQTIRIAITDAATTTGTDPDRASFSIALQTARDQVIHAADVIADTVIDLIGTIGRTVLDQLMPARRLRVSPRAVKRPLSRYAYKSLRVDRRTYQATVKISILTRSPDP